MRVLFVALMLALASGKLGLLESNALEVIGDRDPKCSLSPETTLVEPNIDGKIFWLSCANFSYMNEGGHTCYFYAREEKMSHECPAMGAIFRASIYCLNRDFTLSGNASERSGACAFTLPVGGEDGFCDRLHNNRISGLSLGYGKNVWVGGKDIVTSGLGSSKI
ncbi:hypothetical protein TRVL_01967 [Trypanosoma vivax]|nr:hypothetical protein TRVL_01967 [Trypanosoma vivax]